jgi:glycine/D-amino acid oxidase-like deaminating enzyme
MGWRDVVLLERDRLTSGTTWHAAGLMVTFGSTSETSTEMRKYTRDLYARLEAETGQATGFKPVRLHRGRRRRDRLEEYRRVSAFNRYCGVDVHEISPREVGDLFPLARTDDLLAGFYVKDDGRSNPVDVTMALAKGARQQGATILEGVPPPACTTRGGAVTGVAPATATIEASTSSTAPACGPASSARRRQHPAAGRRALLPHHRARSPASRRAGRCSRTPAPTATSARRSAA